MLARLSTLSAAAFVAFGMTAPALAQPHYDHHRPPPAWHRQYRHPAQYRPWVYSPPPVLIAPAAPYYAPPPPVYYAPAPSLNFSFSLP